MGVVASKSPLERRNTVLRRSQRKSMHGAKSKAEKLAKDIRKFKGTEENTDFIELKARIESMERDLKIHAKNLQPQIRPVYNEALKKTEECHKLLDDKLRENEEKFKEKQEKQAEKKKDEKTEVKEENEDDDVFIEEIEEEGETPDKRKTVELKLVQVEPIEMSPQINKRLSAMKIGVPVMPTSMIASLHRKTEELNSRNERRISQIRAEIETVEVEISKFVGRKDGKYYKRIRGQLEFYSKELSDISSEDEDIQEQMKLCANYIGSCLSFLEEKAVEDDVDGDDDDDEPEETVTKATEIKGDNSNSLSPRNIRTTYI